MRVTHAITLTHLFFKYFYEICYYLLTQLFRELPKILSLIIYSTYKDRVYCENIRTFSLLSCSVNLAFSSFKNASSLRRISFCNFSVVAILAIYTYVALCISYSSCLSMPGEPTCHCHKKRPKLIRQLRPAAGDWH